VWVTVLTVTQGSQEYFDFQWIKERTLSLSVGITSILTMLVIGVIIWLIRLRWR